MIYDPCHDTSAGGSSTDANGVVQRCSETARHDPGYRNIFGPTKPCERYQGAGSESATRAMLRRLAKSMRRAGTADDSQIPAGYTYLAQFAAHDLVHNPTRIPNQDDSFAAQHDLREQRLMLETLYGGGPVACPHLFHREAFQGTLDRSRLRLLFVHDDKQLPADMRTGKRGKGGAYRDLPRIVIDDGPIDVDSFETYGDALLADGRNDDHLIIAQLTVIFSLLHNLFDERLRETTGLSGRQRFTKASKATTYVYRQILFRDLLPRLLQPLIWDAYELKGFRLERDPDPRMTVEFAHAVFRAGHSMVRAKYKLNDLMEPPVPSLERILLRRGRTPRNQDLPHRGVWLIDWSKFFQTSRKDKVQAAARISPSVQKTLLDDSSFNDRHTGKGDLLLADLLRGALSDLRSVQSLIDCMSARDLPGHCALRRENWEPMLAHWLEAKRRDGELTTHDVTCLLQDPPLLLFVMFEAMSGSPQHAFGLLGSAVVAETFFAARDRTERMIEYDEETRTLVSDVFDRAQEKDVEQSCAGPSDMPSMIAGLARHLGYIDLKHPFI